MRTLAATYRSVSPVEARLGGDNAGGWFDRAPAINQGESEVPMATATPGRAEIEKVVRKVLAEERPGNDRATLKAIQRVSALLTEQVIPNLPDSDEDDGSGAHNGSGTTSNAKSFGGYSAGEDIDDDGQEGLDDDAPTAEVPQPVMEAFESLYQALSPEQANALAEFFTAVSEEIGEGNEGSEGEDAEAESHVA
jgi:hypothetical protein